MGGPQGPFRSVRWSDRTWLLVRLLLAGAVDYARERRVRMLEAYPVDKLERSPDDFMYFGSRAACRQSAAENRSPSVPRIPHRSGSRADLSSASF